MVSSGSGDTSARPSARARAFCSSMALRTAGMPPRSSCSATGICSGRSSASAALRCVDTVCRRRGRSALGAGTAPRSGAVRAPGVARAGPDRARARLRLVAVGSRRPRASRPGRAALGTSRPGAGLARARVGAVGAAALVTRGRAAGRRCARAGAPRARRRRAGPIAAAVLVAAAPSGGEDDRHAPGALSRPEPTISMRGHLLGAGVVSRGLHRGHDDALEVELGVGPQDVADLGAVGAGECPRASPRAGGPRGRARSTCRRRGCWSVRYRFCRVIGVGPRYRRRRHGENTVARPCPVGLGAAISVEVLRIRANRAPGAMVRSLI